MSQKLFVEIGSNLFFNKNDIGGLKIAGGFNVELSWAAFLISSGAWVKGRSVTPHQFNSVLEELDFKENEIIWFNNSGELHCVSVRCLMGYEVSADKLLIKTAYSKEYIEIKKIDVGMSAHEFSTKIKPFSQTEIDAIEKILKS